MPPTNVGPKWIKLIWVRIFILYARITFINIEEYLFNTESVLFI